MMNFRTTVVSFLTFVGCLLLSQLSQAQQLRLTRQAFRAMPATQKPEYVNFAPTTFPNGFAHGQLALTRVHTGGSAYVVAREGISLPGLSTVTQQMGTNMLFNAAGASSFPALASFPDRLYSGSQIIEVIHWSARYDDAGLRAHASRARRERLSNQRLAYYLEQDTGRAGWCTFADESAQYSDFLCVNIENSPQTALTILQSIISHHSNFHP
jgi:hypothetical protein